MIADELTTILIDCRADGDTATLDVLSTSAVNGGFKCCAATTDGLDAASKGGANGLTSTVNVLIPSSVNCGINCVAGYMNVLIPITVNCGISGCATIENVLNARFIDGSRGCGIA